MLHQINGLAIWRTCCYDPASVTLCTLWFKWINATALHRKHISKLWSVTCLKGSH